MNSFVRNDDFFEKDFNKRCQYSSKLNSSITRGEIIPLYIEYYEKQLKKLKKRGYIPTAQIIINTNRYIDWLNSQLPIDERDLKDLRLKVNCSTATFGHIINELIYRDYVEATKSTNGEINFNSTARIIQKTFLLLQKDGKTEVNFNHLASEIRNSTLSDDNKHIIRLPSNK